MVLHQDLRIEIIYEFHLTRSRVRLIVDIIEC